MKPNFNPSKDRIGIYMNDGTIAVGIQAPKGQKPEKLIAAVLAAKNAFWEVYNNQPKITPPVIPAPAPVPAIKPPSDTHFNGRTHLNVAEVSRITGMSVGYWRKLISRREIPHVTFGRAVKIPRESLDKWIAERNQR